MLVGIKYLDSNISNHSSGSGFNTLKCGRRQNTCKTLLTVRRFPLDALFLASLFLSLAYIQPARASPDFSISADPSSVMGPSVSSTITVTSLNGFSGSVNVSASISPPGPSFSLSNSSYQAHGIVLNLASGSVASTTLAAYSNISGNFTITITGTDGSTSHSVTVHYTAQPFPTDFSIDCCFPLGHGNMGRVAVGTDYTSWSWVTSLNHFSGEVSISASLNLNVPVTVSPTTVYVPNGGMVEPVITFQLSSSSAPGEYYGTITATNGTITHSEALTLTVDPPPPDFGVSANPVSLRINSWVSGIFTIAVTSINGFETHWNCLSLDVVVRPSVAGAPVPTIRPNCVYVASGGTSFATLSIQGDANTPTGNSTFIVTACLSTTPLGPVLCRYTTFYVTVTKGNDVPPVDVVFGGSGAAALTIAVIVLRKKRTIVPS